MLNEIVSRFKLTDDARDARAPSWTPPAGANAGPAHAASGSGPESVISLSDSNDKY
jgi:hypothetical protein